MRDRLFEAWLAVMLQWAAEQDAKPRIFLKISDPRAAWAIEQQREFERWMSQRKRRG